MNGFDTYQQLAMRTAKPMEVQDDLLHAALACHPRGREAMQVQQGIHR